MCKKERRDTVVQLSIAQIETKLHDKKFNLEKIEHFLCEAKQKNSDLVLFPELSLTGYSIGPWLREAAEARDGQSITYLKNLCKKWSINTLLSFPEIYQQQYFISAAFISDNGEIEAVYRKTHLYDEEQVYFTPGHEIPVFNTKFGVIGMMSCFDLEFPEVARILSKKGADLILIPTSNMAPYTEHQRLYTQCRAMENEIPLALCNRIGVEGRHHFMGESVFVDAQGETHLLLSDQEELHTIPVLLMKGTDPKLNYILDNQPHLYKQLYS
nr:carbon-nitrogen hydrolase family protein [Aneurinibacillus aneurinilyticus]